MAYTPNSYDTAEPLGGRFAGSAAAEFRTMKSAWRKSLQFPQAEATLGELASAAARAGKLLAFDTLGNLTYLLPNVVNVPDVFIALASLADNQGGGLVGYHAGRTYADGTVGDKLKEYRSVMDADFGVKGNGVDNDTAGINAALAWSAGVTNGNDRPGLYFPAGIYLHDRIAPNSLRGIDIKGVGTLDPTKRRSHLKFSGLGGTDAAWVLTSDAYIKIAGLTFDMNNVSGMTNFILFAANESIAVPPLNNFSTNFIMFEDCSFYVAPTIAVQPAQMIFAKSCSSIFFNRCNFTAQTVLKLGKDTDVDANTGNPTLANGLCVVVEINDSYINGDILCEKVYNLVVRNTQFYTVPGQTYISKVYCSGNKVAINGLFDNCVWDSSGVSNYNGVLIDWGDNASLSGNLQVTRSQLQGKNFLVQVNRGDAVVELNRCIANSGSSLNRIVQANANARNIFIRGNNNEEYLSVNTAGSVKARVKVDARTQKLPYIANDNLAADLTVAAAAAWSDLFTSNFKFGGQEVRINYRVNIKHNAVGTPAVYAVRVLLNGAVIAELTTRVTATAQNDLVVLTATKVVYIDATDASVALKLQVRQESGATLGTVQSTASATPSATGWDVELLNT